MPWELPAGRRRREGSGGKPDIILITVDALRADHLGLGDRYALRTRDWKLISTLTGAHELYNLRADPQELRNIASTELDRTVHFRDTLMRILASSARMGQDLQGQYAPIRPRVLERLKSLGYVR